MNDRKTVSLKPRTHARLIALTEGFDDSCDKIINRLIDLKHKVENESKS
jgi:hypothetical protein